MHVLPASDSPQPLSELERAVAQLDELETLPSVAQRVLTLTSDPDCDLADVIEIIAPDPGLNARLLKVANSAYFSRPVNHLRGAIVRLGLRDVRSLAVTAALVAGEGTPFTRQLWDHSLRCATLTQTIAAAARADIHDPFLCGLLHEFGTLVLTRLYGDAYADVAGLPGSDDQAERERDAYGFDHCDIGALVAERWHLPAELPYVIQFHHAPDALRAIAPPEQIMTAVDIVALARRAAQVDFEAGEVDPGQVAAVCPDPRAFAPAVERAAHTYHRLVGELL